ncbi:MAG TPA: hypothetical protein VGS04_08125 [Nitrososphaerales archaeon]|nr:hypothetical protein [Nitrospira sp.]HEV2390674.1 hypothetical protein [Nitrososphaerales archaeon]
MKTLRTIATVLLAAFLVLGPVAAFAAGETVTVSTDAKTYSGNATIQVSGTVTPAPSAAGTAVVVTTTGPMGAVDTGTAPVAATTGTYSYVLVAGSPQWIGGTYTVNATYGGPGGTGSMTTTFAYQGVGPGGEETDTVTTTVTTTVAQATITSTVTTTSAIVNPDTAQLNTIQTALTSITNTLGTITSSLNTISSGITAIQSSITSSTSGFGALAGVPGQITTLTNDVNNNQTYVLVVAALAAITLVLELAILVRKLS